MNGATPLINFTDSAARKVQQLIDEEQDDRLSLRVYITGGGCSGFQYGFTFEASPPAADDIVIEKSVDDHQVRLLIDPMSFMYLKGADIDYREGLSGAQFVIRNPNAKTTCGCGSSFSVGDD